MKAKYLGLDLSSPVVVSSSPYTATVSNIEQCVRNGAGAVVLKSIFEEQIIRHAAAITSVPRITLMRSAITTTILVESRYRLAISLFSYPRIFVMEIAFSFFSMISFVRR